MTALTSELPAQDYHGLDNTWGPAQRRLALLEHCFDAGTPSTAVITASGQCDGWQPDSPHPRNSCVFAVSG